MADLKSSHRLPRSATLEEIGRRGACRRLQACDCEKAEGRRLPQAAGVRQGEGREKEGSR